VLLAPFVSGHFGDLTWDAAVFGYQLESADDTTFDERDSAPFVPKCVVVDPNFDWKGEPSRRAVPWEHTVIYELHLRDNTKLHPSLPKEWCGPRTGSSRRSSEPRRPPAGAGRTRQRPDREPQRASECTIATR
jgi:isoamylase